MDTRATAGARRAARGHRGRDDPDLRIDIETEVPERLDVGLGAGLFVFGSAHHDRSRITDLHLAVDGTPHDVLAQGMPRRDGPSRLYRTSEPFLLEQLEGRQSAYMPGFWGIVPLPAPERPTSVDLDLVADLADGGTATRSLGAIRLEPRDRPAAVAAGATNGAGAQPPIAICMATFSPDLELFEQQIESIRNQTYPNWSCVISDDASGSDVIREMRRVIGDDERFRIFPGSARLGFYRNFERALSHVPDDARYIALADQDDRWHADKLEVLEASLAPESPLVYSDTRIVSRDGNVLADTFWTHRANNRTNLGSLVMMNTITGAAALFRRELLPYLLPFPSLLGPHSYHDQWIAAVALSLGDLGYVDRPLYDYVQHEGAVLGHSAAEAGGRRPSALRRLAASLFGWRTAYFADYCRILLLSQVLTLRCGDLMEPSKRRSLERVAGDGPRRRAGWLALRSLRPKTRRSKTAGAERSLLRGMAWPRTVRWLNRRRPQARKLFDASLPPPVKDAIALPPDVPIDVETLRRKIEPVELKVSTGAPERVNVLIPAVDLAGFFAGYLSIYNLAQKLAQRGLRTRIVATEGTYGMLPDDWEQQLQAKHGLEGLLERVEFDFPRDVGRPLEVSPRDVFVATAWSTAHTAHAAAEQLDRDRFLYLIQDYEPIFYPLGSWHSAADQTYRFPHLALFSTELLRTYFRRHELGVYAGGNGGGDQASASFQNAITPVEPPTVDELAAHSARKLLFYTRLENYTPRNLFGLGVIALQELIAEGAFGSEWEFHGVGSVGGAERVKLGSNTVLEMLPRQPEGRYADMLRQHDLGLSLMYSPHPSLVPLEMASAGMLVVTNTYENKTPAALAEISENLIGAEPTVEGLKQGFREAIAGVDDLERRVRGARVSWSTDWETSLSDPVMDRVAALLDGC